MELWRCQHCQHCRPTWLPPREAKYGVIKRFKCKKGFWFNFTGKKISGSWQKICSHDKSENHSGLTCDVSNWTSSFCDAFDVSTVTWSWSSLLASSQQASALSLSPSFTSSTSSCCSSCSVDIVWGVDFLRPAAGDDDDTSVAKNVRLVKWLKDQLGFFPNEEKEKMNSRKARVCKRESKLDNL